jgi:hypothetical protein
LDSWHYSAMEEGDPLGWALQFALNPELPKRGLGPEFTDWVAEFLLSGAEEDGWEWQTHLSHCLFGNPFRPMLVDRGWLVWNDGAIPQLAKAAYADRALPVGRLNADRLAILADALEDAGCANLDVLIHLRGLGPHLRGCHVLDALLGKK